MSTVDNPIISCTLMQLAFVAWQTERFGIAAYKAGSMPLDPTPEFTTWWETPTPVVSMRDVCWRSWLASRGGSERYDDLATFGVWWQTIVDGQPSVSSDR